MSGKKLLSRFDAASSIDRSASSRLERAVHASAHAFLCLAEAYGRELGFVTTPGGDCN